MTISEDSTGVVAEVTDSEDVCLEDVLVVASSFPNSKYIAILEDGVVDCVRENLNNKSRELFSHCQKVGNTHGGGVMD